jgi:hypothetical protein
MVADWLARDYRRPVALLHERSAFSGARRGAFSTNSHEKGGERDMKRAYRPPSITTHGDIHDLTRGQWSWGDGDGVWITVRGRPILELPLSS